MNRNTLLALTLTLILSSFAFPQHAPVPSERFSATIDTRQTAEPVSPYVFGGFIEHIAKTMYSSLWAEMVDDRKFYFPIVTKDPAGPGPERVFPGMQFRKWRPFGGDEVVTLDKEKPFVGEQSPRIKRDASTPRGIRQTGLGLVKGKLYAGRIYLRGARAAR